MKKTPQKIQASQNTLLSQEQEEKIICQLFSKDNKIVLSVLQGLSTSNWSETIATHLLGCYAFHSDKTISKQALEILKKKYPEYYKLSKKVHRPRFQLETAGRFFVQFLAPLQEQGAHLNNDFQLIYEWGTFFICDYEDRLEMQIFQEGNPPKDYLTSVKVGPQAQPVLGGFMIHPEKVKVFTTGKDLIYSHISMHTLPPGIGRLQGLEELYLEDCPNLLSLPNTLADLKNLRDVSFDGCSKLSTLSPFIEAWKKLEVLSLRGCKSIKSLPNALGQLPKLEVILDHDGLRLLSFPALRSIRSLILDCNWTGGRYTDEKDIRQLFILLSKFPNLEELRIIGSKMNYLPAEIALLKKLKILELTNCKFKGKGLSPELGQLKNLHSLEINSCTLSELPPELGELEKLEELKLLFIDKLKFLPTTLGKLKHLRKFELYELNKLESLPNEMGQWKNLREVSLQYCKTLKELPAEIGGWGDIEFLRLCEVGLTYLPNQIGQWKKIKEVELSYLPLKSLPSSIKNWAQLKNIHLYGCSLKELPAELLEDIKNRGSEVSFY